ncbi:hypothetical protein TGAM01_v207997 [Trichoderma gamsii]|uniref:Zn(2)-C6 fungal-type domain-containing protein n=1 Tax=Trichoderma gamsii TaxID=398673 RepID=A0A2P4ZFZ3_9HYPO|nr:hypothetical protein TGAM01_v207997 [Trichoderma gamsii]PON23224.1 hypothetical protein TGAM01_v207997 [Trichoderma gamsii]
MAEQPPRPKQAACLVCRRSKIKCDWMPYEAKCRRCIHLNCECIRPEFHPGRQKGIKNKRVGIDKALYQIEQAVKRVKSGEPRGAQDRNLVANLRQLLDDVDASEDATEHSSRQGSQSNTQDEAGLTSSEDDDENDSAGQRSMADFVQRTEESLAIDDAENPLQLLARASYFRPSSGRRSRRDSPQNPQHDSSSSKKDPESARVERFFSQTKVKLDVGEDLDPVDLGLVTMDEAESLFDYYYSKLVHTRWGLSPRVHTAAYTRSRSAFLFTTVMAASTLFMPTAGPLSKRLFNHVKLLAQKVINDKYKSVEIVLAFMTHIPWIFPGDHTMDDETCIYISIATTIAFDLSLHKTLMPRDALESGSTNVSRGECLDPRAALAIDGFPDVDPWSEQGQLLLRARERCYISLFVVERGMSLARGRPFMIPITRNIKDVDTWHRSPLADEQDGPVASMAAVRRDLDSLFNTVRALCDGSQTSNSDGSLVARSIQGSIERFFDQWLAEWGLMIGLGPERRLPPYVEILFAHTRLSTYGRIINHPTAPVEVRIFFRTAGLSAALNVMRAAIQGESQLQSMPNNTAIMISFAACFALNISSYAPDGSGLAPSIRRLIEEATGVLERIGTITPHRNGLSVLYGKHLQHLLQTSGPPKPNRPPKPRRTTPSSTEPMQETPPAPPSSFMDQQVLWPDMVQFSTMSDDQITQVLNQPGNVFEPSFGGGMSWEDMNNFDWLNWPAFNAN